MTVKTKMKFNSITKCFWQTPTFKAILIVVILFGVIVPLVMQITLLLHQTSSIIREEEYLESRKILYEDLAVKKAKIDSLEDHIRELNQVQFKALQYLSQLDKKRLALLSEISDKTKLRDSFLTEIKSYNKQIQKLKKESFSFSDLKSQKVIKNVVYVGMPKKITLQVSNNNFEQVPDKPATIKTNHCDFKTCFDYSRCSSVKDFKFFLTQDKECSLQKLLQKETEYTEKESKACITINFLKINTLRTSHKRLNSSGANNIIIIEPNPAQDISSFCKTFNDISGGNAIFAAPWLCEGFRTQFDYVIPYEIPLMQERVWKALQPIVPLSRKYILTFAHTFLPTANKTEHYLEKELLLLNDEKDVYIKMKCPVFHKKCTAGWCICYENPTLLLSSKFTVIPVDLSNSMLYTNIIDALRSGCVPVFFGDTSILPFQDTIDWKKAAILLPYQRIPELMFLLRSLPNEDLITLKRHGRFLYETYLASSYTFVRTLISNLQANIGLPPTPLGYVKADKIMVLGGENKPSLNPHGTHNLSYVGQGLHEKWNTFPGALHMVPVDPLVEPPPSEYQFIDEGKDYFMPIGDGKGGDGVAFARSLGGDYPLEQFTVLMLTYDRDVILMEALQRLSGLKYLHKIVVVWNNPVGPSDSLTWPDVGVKIEVIRTGRNSLNNRFIPYDVIETDAILSMDDDIYLRHDEIELAFRIWRENRDRLVGFPGRHHSYNSSSNYFYYNSEHSCELSLVLTGGAFFHKYYSYVYTYNMENSIKKMVDDYMNCEDIAMNFLVSHVTRKPPIKVTSRWTFRCPGCPVALSADADHYRERNVCMEYFQKVYGYNPLKRTQFRADSILFKTRIPATMAKCFQFV